jgi:cholest-4-en-3-one 26-monooxygenase
MTTLARGPDLAAVDLLDLDRWAADGPPFAWFARAREVAPVWRHPGPAGGRGFWVVTGHEQVTALGRRPHALSSDQDHGGVVGLGDGDEMQAAFDESRGQLAPAGQADAKMLLSLDPPEHTENRKILNRGFTPRAISELEPAVRSLAAGLLDAHRPGEVFDFTTEVAMPLPMQVIGDLLGAPRETHRDLLRWSNEAVAGTDPEYMPEGGSQLAAAMHLAQLFGGLRLAREAEPGDDLVSRLLAGAVDGAPLSDLRYLMYLLLLVTAGNETTRNAMSHGVWAFAAHPEQWQRLREDPGLLDTAVEEVLRWSSPVLYFRRNALEETTVAGATIEPGDIVSLWYVAANRDGAVFDRPDELDVGRTPNHHVAFGGGGPHFCLGAGLARLELRVLLEEMLARWGSIELAGEPSRLRSNFLNGVKHLPVVTRS